VYRMIEAHRREHSDTGSLLDLMLAASPDHSPASEQYLRDQVITIFLAGYETVANALSWTWYLLSQNPECEGRFHDEIDAELAGRQPSYDDLPRLRYVGMVMAESMRLYPPAWAMGRYARNDFQLGDFFLPAKTTVLMSQFIMHRDPRFFPDPLRFDPERFSPEAKARLAKFTYFPFGAGVRQCIGESFDVHGGRALAGHYRPKMEIRIDPGAPCGTGTLDHAPAEIRYANAGASSRKDLVMNLRALPPKQSGLPKIHLLCRYISATCFVISPGLAPARFVSATTLRWSST